MHLPVADKRENGGRIIPRLALQDRKVDGSPVEAGGSAGFQPPDGQFELPKPGGETD
jgi:hypothetical protein